MDEPEVIVKKDDTMIIKNGIMTVEGKLEDLTEEDVLNAFRGIMAKMAPAGLVTGEIEEFKKDNRYEGYLKHSDLVNWLIASARINHPELEIDPKEIDEIKTYDRDGHVIVEFKVKGD